MSSNSTSPASANAYKVFNRPDQWDDWLDQTKWFMQQQDLWEYMDPELDTRPAEPQRPTLPSMDECIDAKEAAEPTPEQRRINRRIDFHRLFLPEYQEFSKKRDKANKYFTTYVDIKWQHYLADRPTLHSKLKALEKHVAPCEESRVNALRTKFISLQKGKSPTISMSTYLHTWQLLERRMVAYRMSERSSMKHAFAKAIAIGNPSIYNLLRAAGDITANILPPLEAMIEIVRHELTVETERKSDRTVNATYQDNVDDDDSAGGRSKEGGGGSGGRKGGGKKKNKEKQEKRGCGFVTKKPDNKQCASLSECDVANAQLWPEEADRTVEWEKALESYKLYCRNNQDFCDKAANTFQNPAAVEVWEKYHGKKAEQQDELRFAGATVRSVNSGSHHHGRQGHWLYDNCANSHVLNDVRRVDFEVTEIPTDSFIAAGSDHFRVVAVGTCKLRIPRLNGGSILLTLLDVPYIPGFHTNIVSEARLRKSGLWYHGRYDQMYHQDKPIVQLIRRADGLPWFDIVTPLYDDRPAISDWPRRADGKPMAVDEAYRSQDDPFEELEVVSRSHDHGPPSGPLSEVLKIVQASSHQPSERKVTPTLLHHLRENQITLQTTSIYTPAQDPAEQADGVILNTARTNTMRASSGLPQDLWPEIVKAAITPIKKKGWKTSLELAAGKKPRIGHLRVFGCRAYAHQLGSEQPPRLDKLAERAHMGYLVGWEPTNIFRIWAPSLETILRTREGVSLLDEDSEEPERSQYWVLKDAVMLPHETTCEGTSGEPTHLQNSTDPKALGLDKKPQTSGERAGDRETLSHVEPTEQISGGPPTRPQAPNPVKYDEFPPNDKDDDSSIDDTFMHNAYPLEIAEVKHSRKDDEDDGHDDKRLRILYQRSSRRISSILPRVAHL